MRIIEKMMADLKIDAKEVMVAGVTGTGFMTAFSYIVSYTKEHNFREPELLAELLTRLMPSLQRGNARIIGWKLHYAVGLLFALCYCAIWKQRMQAGLKSGLLLGALSGLLAIAVWNAVLSLHPDPPKINRKRYSGHLFVTHLVFAVFAAVGYKLAKRIKI